MLKASFPNEWSYELAEEVVGDYVQRNFVDKGMCADGQSTTARTIKDSAIYIPMCCLPYLLGGCRIFQMERAEDRIFNPQIIGSVSMCPTL